MKRTYILNAFLDSPWAILPSMFPVLQEIVMRHVAGEKLSMEEIQMRTQGGSGSSQAPRTAGSVAVLPVHGPIAPRMHLMENISSGVSADRIGQAFQALVNDPSVSAIVLDISSPGGQASGIEELSDKIFSARGVKPIVAVANPMMASAAYWIGTAADEIVVTPSGQVGSIGVYTQHADWSGNLEKEGIKVSLISAGKYKTEGNYFEPLSDEARTHIQDRVSEIYDNFIDAVARNRNVKSAVVRNGFGEGRVVTSRKAVELGMADRIGTLDETVNRLLGQDRSPAAEQTNLSGNVPSEQASSEPEWTDDMEREALSLREKVQFWK